MKTTTAVQSCISSQMKRAICKLPKLWKTNSKSKVNLKINTRVNPTQRWKKVIYRPFCRISLTVTWTTKMIMMATKTFLILRICEIWKRSVRMELRATKRRDSFIWRFDDLGEFISEDTLTSTNWLIQHGLWDRWLPLVEMVVKRDEFLIEIRLDPV